MEDFRYFVITVILLKALVTGIDFTFSKQKVLLGSQGTITLTCNITETDVAFVYLLQIRRLRSTSLSGSDPTDWTTLALIEPGVTDSPSLLGDITANTKDYVAGGSYDSVNPSNAVLTLSMNINKLVCEDARYYGCDLSYKSSKTGSVATVKRKSTFAAYVKPQVTSLIARKNGIIIQGSSSADVATVNVGDELELTCTANIGSLSGTIIRWNRTTETASTNEFIDYEPPQSTFIEGTTTSDNQCGYIRVANITYNTTVADANRENNLAFECYVTVDGDPYGSYTSENNPKFYADVTDSGAQTTQPSHRTSVPGIDFTFSKQKVLLGSEGTLTMTCVITGTDIGIAYLLQIRRLRSTSLSGSDPTDWTTLALIEPGLTDCPSLHEDITANDKDYVASGSLDSANPSNGVLILSLNKHKLLCDDARYYKCELSYKSLTTGGASTVKRNGTFTAYVMPKVTSLIVRKNDFIVQGSSPTEVAAVNIGDELEIMCTANIGSLPGTIIRWHRTSEKASTNEFIDYQPPQGTLDRGTSASDNQCGYTRVTTITYNVTPADAKRENNLAFECYVTVNGDPYGAYTSENNPKFYANVTGSGALTTSVKTSGDDKISVSLVVIVGIAVASMTTGVLIGVVISWVIMRRIMSVQGSGEQNQHHPIESQEMRSVVSASTTHVKTEQKVHTRAEPSYEENAEKLTENNLKDGMLKESD